MKKYFAILLIFSVILIGNAQSGNSENGSAVTTQRPGAEVKVKIFPNPAVNVVNILGLKDTSKADIAIIDIYGNIILAYKWAIRRNALNIPISTLEPGAYIIRIHSDEQQLQMKFYKQ